VGDLGPSGRRDSRGGGCLFLWRSVGLRLACRKVAQVFGYVAPTVFPGAIQSVGIPMLGLCRRWKLVSF